MREKHIDSVAGLVIIAMILMHIFQWCNLRNTFYCKCAEWIVIAVSIVLAAVLSYSPFVYPTTASNSILGLSFFLLGVKLKNIQYDKRFYTPLIIISAALAFAIPSSVAMMTNGLTTGNYFIWYITTLGAIIFSNNFFKLFTLYSFPLLRLIGRNALYFYSIHWIIILAVGNLANHFGRLSELMVCLIMIFANALLLPVLTISFKQPRLRFLFGAKISTS